MKIYPKCPTCGRSTEPEPKKPKRICGFCKKPILIHDAWYMNDGQCFHRDCEQPRKLPTPVAAEPVPAWLMPEAEHGAQ